MNQQTKTTFFFQAFTYNFDLFKEQSQHFIQYLKKRIG
jgi:hypothetical protein